MLKKILAHHVTSGKELLHKLKCPTDPDTSYIQWLRRIENILTHNAHQKSVPVLEARCRDIGFDPHGTDLFDKTPTPSSIPADATKQNENERVLSAAMSDPYALINGHTRKINILKDYIDGNFSGDDAPGRHRTTEIVFCDLTRGSTRSGNNFGAAKSTLAAAAANHIEQLSSHTQNPTIFLERSETQANANIRIGPLPTPPGFIRSIGSGFKLYPKTAAVAAVNIGVAWYIGMLGFPSSLLAALRYAVFEVPLLGASTGLALAIPAGAGAARFAFRNSTPTILNAGGPRQKVSFDSVPTYEQMFGRVVPNHDKPQDIYAGKIPWIFPAIGNTVLIENGHEWQEPVIDKIQDLVTTQSLRIPGVGELSTANTVFLITTNNTRYDEVLEKYSNADLVLTLDIFSHFDDSGMTRLLQIIHICNEARKEGKKPIENAALIRLLSVMNIISKSGPNSHTQQCAFAIRQFVKLFYERANNKARHADKITDIMIMDTIKEVVQELRTEKDDAEKRARESHTAPKYKNTNLIRTFSNLVGPPITTPI